MAEQTYRELTDEKGNVKAVIVSEGNKPRTDADFEFALKSFQEGKEPEGFRYIDNDLIRNIRVGFENVREAIPQAGESIGRGIGSAPDKLAQFLTNRLTQGSSPGNVQLPSESPFSLSEPLGRTGRFLGDVLSAPFSNPTTAGATLGTIASSLATRNITPLLQMLGIGLGGLTGASLGQLGGGESFHPGSIALEGGIAALGSTPMAAYKVITGRVLSKAAQNQLAGDLMKYIKQKYSSLAADPALLDAMAEDPKALGELVRMGINSIRGDFDQTIRQFVPTMTGIIKQDVPEAIGKKMVSEVEEVLPRSLSKGSQNTLRAELRNIQRQGGIYLDNLDDPVKMQGARNKMTQSADVIRDLVKKEFSSVKNLSPTQAKLEVVLQRQAGEINKYLESAEVLQAIKRNTVNGRIDVKSFQRDMRDTYMRSTGTHISDLAEIAGMGGDVTQSLGREFNARLPVGRMLGLGRIPFAGDIGYSKKLGESYIGNINATLPLTTPAANVAGSEAIRGIIQRKGEEGSK